MGDVRRLVVTADDFGFSEGINRGIVEAAEAGIVRSASIMVNMPAFEDAARRARCLGDGFGVGLHLTLTVGAPFTHAPSLVCARTGAFVGPGCLLGRALSGRIRPFDVAVECAAQIRRAREAGLRLTHLDGHHHVHAFPGIREVVLEVARAEGIAFVRRPVERLGEAPGRWRRVPTRALLAVIARSLAVGRPRSADHFGGVSLTRSRGFHAALLRFVDRLRPGTTELMVHPGYATGPLPGNDPYVAGREAELRALISAAVRDRLAARNIVVTNFGALA